MSSGDDDDGPKLPQDVLIEILKRLPVESLLRFRSVCRSWRSTIDDPCFVALHLTHCALDASKWHTACLDWRDRLCSLFSGDSLALPPQSQFQIPFGTPRSRYDIGGSCDGLICIVEENYRNIYYPTVHLWNLFTRKHRVVTLPERQWVALGFGFDARSNDYKIVNLPSNHRCGDKISRVEIYSLSTDSWRSLECEVSAHFDEEPALFLNGNLHWFLLKRDDLLGEWVYGSIVSFDVAVEVFDEMALPEEFCTGNLLLYFEVLNGLLAVFVNYEEGVPECHSVCSVWVMREYGVPESLTKLYTFESCAIVIEFYGFMRNGDLLMFIDGGGQVSWNPITRQFENLPITTKGRIITVVESLVSLQI